MMIAVAFNGIEFNISQALRPGDLFPIYNLLYITGKALSR